MNPTLHHSRCSLYVHATGRMTQEIQRIAAAGADWAVTYSYDADGRLVGRTTPSDQAGVAYTYTARGLLASVNGTT